MSVEIIGQYTNDISEDMGGRIPKAILRDLVIYWSGQESIRRSEFAMFRTAVLSQVLKQTNDFTLFLREEEKRARNIL